MSTKINFEVLRQPLHVADIPMWVCWLTDGTKLGPFTLNELEYAFKTHKNIVNAGLMLLPQYDIPENLEVDMDTIEIEAFEWLWQDMIPRKSLTIVLGYAGLGKSQFTLWIASILSNDHYPSPHNLCNDTKGFVYLLNAEDAAADTIKPRLIANKADISRCVYINSALKSSSGKERLLSLDEDLAVIESGIYRRLQRTGIHTVLLVIDPLSAFLGKIDSHKESDVRAVLTKVKNFAMKLGIAVLGVMHPNKNQALDHTLSRISGAAAFGNAPRAVLLVGKHPTKPNHRTIALLKSNNASVNELAYDFHLENVLVDSTKHLFAPRVLMSQYPSDVTVDQLLRAAQPSQSLGKDSSKIDKAVAFLESLFAVKNEYLYEELAQLASGQFDTNLLYRAKNKLGGIMLTKQPLTNKGVWVKTS